MSHVIVGADVTTLLPTAPILTHLSCLLLLDAEPITYWRNYGAIPTAPAPYTHFCYSQI